MVLFVKSERSSKHLGHGDVVWVWQLFVVEGLLFPLSRYAGGGKRSAGGGSAQTSPLILTAYRAEPPP